MLLPISVLTDSDDLQQDHTSHLLLPGHAGGKVPVSGVKEKLSVTSLSTVCG